MAESGRHIYMSKMENLPKFLAERRETLGLSQKEVATKLGYQTPQFVSNWERGLAQPPPDILHKLCAIYKVKPEEMFQQLLNTKMEAVKASLERKFYGRRSR